MLLLPGPIRSQRLGYLAEEARCRSEPIAPLPHSTMEAQVPGSSDFFIPSPLPGKRT